MSMLPIVVSIVVGCLVFMIGVFMLPKALSSNITGFTKKQLKSLEQNRENIDFDDGDSVLRDRYQSTGLLARIYYSLPLGKFSHIYLVRGGMAGDVDRLFLICFGVFIAALILLPFAHVSKNPIVIFVVAVAFAYFVGWRIIQGNINSRISKFVDQFPDALDIIVRSVRSGFPLNAAVNMVAESMVAPASEEFRQISTEVMHGSTLVDALNRLGDRMDFPDIRFFIVVLTLQQEVGGNLAEVLSNLSALIRKRRMMVKKVYAITAEGRFTGWILGALPFLLALGINTMQPDYLLPLFNEPSGHVLIIMIIMMVLLGMAIIRKMVDVEI